jgi:nondiscriminating aspartyl-tRNA synthetase
MNTVVDAFRDYLKPQKFTEIHTSKIVASATEGGAELFKIDYFGRKAFLAQSPQFYKQIMVGVFERVLEVGFVYRAEKHDTPRHLNEYLSLDVEMGFISGLDDLLDLETGLLKHIFKRVREENEEELKLFNALIPDIEFIPRLTLKEVTGILKEEFGKPVIGLDLDAEGERLITEYARKKWGTELVFITHYPLSKRPMYTYPDPANPELSLSFDLIFRGLEITTGGQRIHNYRLLVEKIKERGLNPDDFSYYLDTFKFGMPPHGGFAIGAERLVSRILNLPNIRMASLFPRDRHRLIP